MISWHREGLMLSAAVQFPTTAVRISAPKPVPIKMLFWLSRVGYFCGLKGKPRGPNCLKYINEFFFLFSSVKRMKLFNIQLERVLLAIGRNWRLRPRWLRGGGDFSFHLCSSVRLKVERYIDTVLGVCCGPWHRHYDSKIMRHGKHVSTHVRQNKFVLCYKPDGRRFETQWGEWILSIYLILLATLGPGVCCSSNRNECQKHKNNVCGEQSAVDAYDWHPYRYLWADSLDNVGSLTSHNPIDLHDLLQG
jgi:hypothetical protein